MPLAINNYKWF